jgi:prepilin-type N-terminal cleavage/methylation domain-containing protein
MVNLYLARRRSPSHRAPARGFTLPELVAVLIMVSVLAALAMPRLDGALNLRADTYRDQIVAALRYAGASAVSHRRLVCATVAPSTVTLSIAALNPASSCSTALPGLGEGAGAAAQGRGGTSSSVTPAGTIYFQPSGRVTLDGAGLTAGQWRIDVSGSTPIVLTGETGHVE